MTNINTALQNLITAELTLDADQISKGSKSHTYIRDLLKNKHKEDNKFIRFIEGDFLSGSYARGTKIHPLDDIDVMMVIDGEGLHVVDQGIVQDAEVRSGGTETINPVLQLVNSNNYISSIKIIEHIKAILDVSHPNSKVIKHGQAINVWLSSYDRGIDIVPCFHIIPRDSSQDFYYIPKGDVSDGWMTTNPKIDEVISNDLHVKHNNMFKDVVRLIKYWNKVFNSSRLQSYHLETVIWHTFENYVGSIDSYEEALMYFFENAKHFLMKDCPDKTKLGGPVDAYLSFDNRNASVSALDRTITILNNAYIDPHDQEKILKGWKSILGDKLIF